MTPDLAGLLDGLGRIAGDVGPVLAPAGRDDLVTAVASTAMRMFGAQACSLALLTDDDTELVFTTVVGAGSDRVRGLRLPSGQGIAGWVAMSGQPLVVTDLQRDPRWAGASPDVGYTPRSILAAPVATSERLLGVLEVLDRSEDRPEAAADLELLALVADQAALALEGARAFDDFGRRLLRAAAAAGQAGEAGELPAVLLDAAARLGEPDGDLLELASLFGELGRLDADSRRLAVRVVRAFTDSARERQAAGRRARGR
ncbi:MAG: GAF domain-containing protein [Mycobacteriales bacterium]